MVTIIKMTQTGFSNSCWSSTIEQVSPEETGDYIRAFEMRWAMGSMAGGSTVAEKPKHGGPRKGSGRPKSERKDGTARVDIQILGQAQMVAKRRGISLAEYLSDLLRGPVDRDFLREMKELEKGRKAAESPSDAWIMRPHAAKIRLEESIGRFPFASARK
jgi:hypothetical protein